MRFPFTYTCSVNDGRFAGREVFSIDVEIEAYAEIDEYSDEPFVSIEGVFFNIGDWSKPQFIEAVDCGSPFIVALGSEIVRVAEHDADFIDAVIERSGISWSGKGPNDPNGRFTL